MSQITYYVPAGVTSINLSDGSRAVVVGGQITVNSKFRNELESAGCSANADTDNAVRFSKTVTGGSSFSAGGKYLQPGALNGFRPRLLIFGNSLCGLSNTNLQGGATTVAVAALAGALTVTVAAIGSIVSGNKIAIGLYDGTVFYTTVNGAPAGNVITIAQPMPRMARVNAVVTAYTTAAVTNIRRNGGPLYMGLAMLGMPVDMVQGYGYGGGAVAEIMLDLPRVLEAIRPQFIHFVDVENSMGSSAAALISSVKFKVRTAISYGAIPLVNTAYPSTSYTVGQSATYDAYNAYVLGQMLTDFPQAVALDVAKQWVDGTAPTLRGPLAGWTDGVHPNTNKFSTIGAFYRDLLRSVLPTATSLADSSLTANPLMDGSGGTATGMQGGSVVPASFTYTADAGVTATSSVTAAGDSRVVISVPGTSNVSSTTFRVSQRYTFSANGSGSGQAVMGFAKLKINAMTGVTMQYPYLQFSGGEVYACGQDVDAATDPALIGQTMQLETPIIPVPLGATYVDINYFVRPTSGLSNGVAVDIELLEMGLVPMPYVTH